MSDLVKRKKLRLEHFDYSSCGGYFVTICTHERSPVFGEITGSAVGAALCGRPNNPHKIIEKWLFEIENKFFGTTIDFYVIMPDHIHFIVIKTGGHTGPPLQQIIDWFKTQTTNEYIKGVKSGLYEPFNKHFWQRGYYEHIIRNQQDLDEIRHYIENNPAKWVLENKSIHNFNIKETRK